MKSETADRNKVRPARVVSPRRSIVRFSLVVQDSPPAQATARRHRASTALQRSASSSEIRALCRGSQQILSTPAALELNRVFV
eukprot:4824141-Prymnesium_polylepis.1